MRFNSRCFSSHSFCCCPATCRDDTTWVMLSASRSRCCCGWCPSNRGRSGRRGDQVPLTSNSTSTSTCTRAGARSQLLQLRRRRHGCRSAPFRFVSPPLFSVLLLSSFFSFSFLPQITTNFYFVCDHTLKESREHKNLFTRGMRCSVIDHSIPRVSRRTHILLSPLREEDKPGN